jgi:hypothetical protein
VQQQLAIYRACQDGRGAIRSIIKRQNEGYQNELYKIDKEQIYIGGMSAGALIAMNVAYYDATRVASVFPTVGTYTTEQVMGPINANFYYGGTNISYSIKGVMSMWGGILLPPSYSGMTNQSGFFAGGTNPPMIAFAGQKDKVFWLDPDFHQDTRFSPFRPLPLPPNASVETRCLPNDPPYTPYKIEDLDNSIDLVTGSTLNMYNILQTLNVPSEMYIDCQMKHGLDGKDDLAISDFDTGIANDNDVGTYMVQRACTFFQDVINSVSYGTTLFYECPNPRIKCDVYNGCASGTCNQ